MSSGWAEIFVLEVPEVRSRPVGTYATKEVGKGTVLRDEGWTGRTGGWRVWRGPVVEAPGVEEGRTRVESWSNDVKLYPGPSFLFQDPPPPPPTVHRPRSRPDRPPSDPLTSAYPLLHLYTSLSYPKPSTVSGPLPLLGPPFPGWGSLLPSRTPFVAGGQRGASGSFPLGLPLFPGGSSSPYARTTSLPRREPFSVRPSPFLST